MCCYSIFFFSSRRRHTRWNCDWSSDVCSSDLDPARGLEHGGRGVRVRVAAGHSQRDRPTGDGAADDRKYSAEAFHDRDRKSTRLNSSHSSISYAVFCLKKKKKYYLRLAPVLHA